MPTRLASTYIGSFQAGIRPAAKKLQLALVYEFDLQIGLHELLIISEY
jgi:hypothetical protein